jgi:hypothetical protein
MLLPYALGTLGEFRDSDDSQLGDYIYSLNVDHNSGLPQSNIRYEKLKLFNFGDMIKDVE